MTDRVPPHVYFVVSAVFHYLGPSFAVMLFERIALLGVAWLRIASAALVFAIWRRPWRYFARHRISGRGGLDRLGVSMLIASVAAVPIGVADAAPAFRHVGLLLAGIGVGVSSSVIPYVADQLAMARLPRATFALLLSILPATAVVIGFLVLKQMPSFAECVGIGLVVVGVALHRPAGTH